MKKIKVAKSTFDSWLLKKQWKDIQIIADEGGVHRNTIADVFKTGYATKEVFEIIKNFYNREVEVLK